jgi:hypothetical protein
MNRQNASPLRARLASDNTYGNNINKGDGNVMKAVTNAHSQSL